MRRSRWIPAAALAAAVSTASPAEAAAPASPSSAAPSPPRVDGVYLHATTFGVLAHARVQKLDTSSPLLGAGGHASIGQVVLPHLAIGISLGGHLAYANPAGARQRLGAGALTVDLTAIVSTRYPLFVQGSFGFGGGAVREAGVAGRSGFGGPAFAALAGYHFFPWAERRRPRRGGGLSLAPVVGYLVATPAAAGRPFAGAVIAGLRTSFFFGE